MDWQEQALTLSFGQRRKVKHCGTDPSAYISNGPKGISLHCFRCHVTEFEPHGRLSASDILAMRKQDEAEAQRAYPDVVPLYAEETPSEAHVWVLRAGITPERATDTYGFGWSDRTSRVIVPVLHNGNATGVWTGRALDGRKPKYLMPKGSNGSCWYRLQRNRKACVVVEDVLSAIRVYESGYNALAVLGTTISPVQAALMSDYPVVGWFDGDKAGRDAYVKLRKSLSPYGVEPMRIETSKDPKLYSKGQITQFVEDIKWE